MKKYWGLNINHFRSKFDNSSNPTINELSPGPPFKYIKMQCSLFTINDIPDVESFYAI